MRLSLLILLLTAHSAASASAGLPQMSPDPEEGYSISEVVSRMAESPVSAVEGVWRLVPDGATVAIERAAGSADHYRIVVVDSPVRSLRSGTVIGEIIAGSDANVFDARIYTRQREGRYYMPRTFTLTLDAPEGRIEFRQHKSPLRISLWHFVPFLWRYSVRVNVNERTYLPGAVRIYPSPAKPFSPVYL